MEQIKPLYMKCKHKDRDMIYEYHFTEYERVTYVFMINIESQLARIVKMNEFEKDFIRL